MDQQLKDIESHLTNSDLARADLENRFEIRLKKIEEYNKNLFILCNENEKIDLLLDKKLKELEIANTAQIKVNQLFQQQLTQLEIRLKKEEVKPLVAIPSVPTAWTITKPQYNSQSKQSFLNKIFKK